jgi:hypothetical protein
MKIGAIAAFILAVCYLFGFTLLLTAMNPGDTEGWSQLDRLAFLLNREALFQLWNLIIYVVFGIVLVALTTLLHRLLDRPASSWMSIASPFGFIWAGLVIASGMIASVGLTTVAEMYTSQPEQAASLWSTLGVVQNGLGGGVEVVGGVWVLLISLWSLRSGIGLPKWLNAIGLVVGTAGTLTIVPALSMLGAVFGLVQIVWFLGLGAVLWPIDPKMPVSTN